MRVAARQAPKPIAFEPADDHISPGESKHQQEVDANTPAHCLNSSESRQEDSEHATVSVISDL